MLNVDLQGTSALVAAHQARTVEFELNAARLLCIAAPSELACERIKVVGRLVQNKLFRPFYLAFTLARGRLLFEFACGYFYVIFPIAGRQLGDQNVCMHAEHQIPRLLALQAQDDSTY